MAGGVAGPDSQLSVFGDMGRITLNKAAWILILVLLASLLMAGCQAEQTGVPAQAGATQSGSGQPASPEETDTAPDASKQAGVVDYSFALPEYVSMENGEIGDISLPEYLPSRDMVISYTRPTHEPGGYFFDIRVSDGAANYVAESVPDAEEEGEVASAVVAGRYSYDAQIDCLVDSPAEDLEASTPYAGPVDEQVAATDTLQIETVPHLFRVLTEAGVFDDCIAVRETERDSNGSVVQAVAFYAPGIGNVLRVVDYGIGSAEYRATLVADRIDIVTSEQDGQDAAEGQAAIQEPVPTQQPATPQANSAPPRGAHHMEQHHGNHG